MKARSSFHGGRYSIIPINDADFAVVDRTTLDEPFVGFGWVWLKAGKSLYALPPELQDSRVLVQQVWPILLNHQSFLETGLALDGTQVPTNPGKQTPN